MEPVDAGTIGDCREFSSSDSESTSNRWKTEDNLQLFPHTIDEELPTVFFRVLKSNIVRKPNIMKVLGAYLGA